MEMRHDAIVLEARDLARRWQKRANQLLTRDEKKIQAQMARLLTRPEDKVTLTRLIDQSFRSDEFSRVADQVCEILEKDGIPRFFSPVERVLATLFKVGGSLLPGVSVPKLIEAIRAESSRAIVPGETDALLAHLEGRKAEGVRMNLNHLGEAVLGEEESAERLKTYVKDLESPHVEYISVKISTIYSQINALAFEETTQTLVARLSLLYRTAANNRYTHADGREVPKFVNLDMEEYRDLDITAEAFVRTLDQEEFRNHSAGIVLQAYLPDSHAMQKRLTDWAMGRVAEGGAPIKIRIVKGANMEMEQVDSALHGWPLAPFDNKRDVDANYKKMVDYGMEPERMQAVSLGIASHNLFELAYADCRARQNGVREFVGFEMLEGMADHVRRAIQEMSGDVLYYAPVASRKQFINAIAYLIRRLDENTGAENFLRYACDLAVGSDKWAFLEAQYLDACSWKSFVETRTHRTQDRLSETFGKMGSFHEHRFGNEPDTDFNLAANRRWAEAVREEWEVVDEAAPMTIPLVIGGVEITGDREKKEIRDPSSLKVSATHLLASLEDAERAVAVAKEDPDGWRAMSFEERHAILSKVAAELRLDRGNLVGAAAANTGKLFTETDPEVSEAIDFVEFYPFSTKTFTDLPGVSVTGKGVGLVISPWNFPVAIPCGGVSATLASGNTVIFKPASDAVLAAWQLCQSFWKAGVPKTVLQFLPCSGGRVGSMLAAHEDVDFVILTGGTDTGLSILEKTPSVALSAETGGKNATIVTSMSDRDAAIANIIQSAFGNTGQKCSATSLLILEKDVYEDANFRRQLVDAAGSWHIGSPWDFRSKMGPLVNPPTGDLFWSLTELEDGEEWALKPEQVGENPHLWTPGIKYGVKEKSRSHMTEFFGPVLSVMKAENLDQAIRMVNATGFGLTSGLESLDEREQKIWKSRIKAGNLYINRGTTGAIVLRQPFGGMGKSAIGSGIKAGGPNYVSQFMAITETGWPTTGAISRDSGILRLARDLELKAKWGGFKEHAEDLLKYVRAVESGLYWMEQEFGCEKDYFRLRGQDNLFRYRPVGVVVVRIHEKDTLFDVLTRLTMAKIAGCRVQLSLPEDLENGVADFLLSSDGKRILDGLVPVTESDAALIHRIPSVDRIRYAAEDRASEAVLAAAARTGFYVSRTRVFMEGRLELLQYLREQSLCHSYHRYGNLGKRGLVG